MTGDDAASLAALLSDYGGPLCEITKTPQGYRAIRRSLPASPLVFTATTVPALRELLEHGYDPTALAAVIRDFGGEWQVERIDPGSAWVALSRGGDGLIRVIAAKDLAPSKAASAAARMKHPAWQPGNGGLPSPQARTARDRQGGAGAAPGPRVARGVRPLFLGRVRPRLRRRVRPPPARPLTGQRPPAGTRQRDGRTN